MKQIVVLLVVVTLACGQASTVSPVPKTCNPGDFIDSYGNGAACVAKDKWEGVGSNCDTEAMMEKHGGITYPMVDSATLPWRPNCAWAFKDKSGIWHCPYETASGRVIACFTCDGHYRKNASCEQWRRRCLQRVEIMAHHSTVEASDLSPAKGQETDRSSRYHWTCPDGYHKDWLGEHNEWDSPLCVK